MAQPLYTQSFYFILIWSWIFIKGEPHQWKMNHLLLTWFFIFPQKIFFYRMAIISFYKDIFYFSPNFIARIKMSFFFFIEIYSEFRDTGRTDVANNVENSVKKWTAS